MRRLQRSASLKTIIRYEVFLCNGILFFFVFGNKSLEAAAIAWWKAKGCWVFKKSGPDFNNSVRVRRRTIVCWKNLQDSILAFILKFCDLGPVLGPLWICWNWVFLERLWQTDRQTDRQRGWKFGCGSGDFTLSVLMIVSHWVYLNIHLLLLLLLLFFKLSQSQKPQGFLLP